ncbi:hypothetical protein M3197_12390 [Sporosarcina aquimarina]|uniref:hypothetical protein n=1 Tax=Sporosarcina aquimarina TaxID=114975 RepID=UPI00203AC6B6|nr:hypothetical protein [Sporosarcina aquimarina]MCM3758261.1 hypothetical protein [Sporosarcina aquimarina]
MKKFRGKRRYFRNLWREVEEGYIHLQFDNDAWFDFWHVHLDFFGLGDYSNKIRKEHIKAQITLYKNLLKRLKIFKKPYQSWIYLDLKDACMDAVFIHTPNPNDDNFPVRLENVNWNPNIPISFKGLIDLCEFNVGYDTAFEFGGGYLIQSKHQGVQLHTNDSQ